MIATEIERFGVPGAGVTVVKDGEVLLAEGFGRRSAEGDEPVTDQTLFPIGSSTKAFTSSVVATLVDQGHFGWDTPVADLLPGFAMFDPVATQHLTPRDMLCHRSGLPRHDILWYDNTSLRREDVVRRLRYLEPNKPFRSTWQYNNLLYITAGYLAEVTLGCTWEEAVQQQLLDPLGMTNTNFSVIDAQKSDDHSEPHLQRGGETKVIPWRGLDLAGPAGSINSCAADMARWALLNTGGGEVDGQRILSSAALRELHKPNMALVGSELSSVADLYTETYMTAYGMGWVLESYRGHRIVHHGGNIDGFSAMVSMLPEENLGVVVLTNLNGTPCRDVIPYVIYDYALGLDPLPWGERMVAVRQAVDQGTDAAQAHAAAKTKGAPPSHALDDYAGLYTHPGYGPFTITVEDGALVPHYNDVAEFVLVHRHYDVWELHLELFKAVMPLTFVTDPAGEIASFSVPLEGSVDPIVFTRQADPALSDPELLASYAGRFVMGPLPLTVEFAPPGALVATVTGSRLKLLPYRAGEFKVEGHSDLTIEFVRDGGAVTQVVIEGVGVFTPASEE